MLLTLLEQIQRGATYLNCQEIDNPRREAEEVIADVLDKKRLDLYLQYDAVLTHAEQALIQTALERRGRHEPTAYIAGRVAFGGLSFSVEPGVLIPRPETEILVEMIAHTLMHREIEGRVLWDMCCGTGCMGITLQHRFPSLRVILSDLSPQALQVASRNAAGALSCRQGDLFAPFRGERCDFFLCNPPYISSADFSRLDPEVRDWEPKEALLAGPTGLEYYVKIAQELKQYLKQDGLAWLEIGTGQGPAVCEIFRKEGWECRYEKDWAGHDRFLFVS